MSKSTPELTTKEIKKGLTRKEFLKRLDELDVQIEGLLSPKEIIEKQFELFRGGDIDLDTVQKAVMTEVDNLVNAQNWD